MKYFDNQIHIKTKNIGGHPWGATIKDKFASSIKYAHNSVNNPHYEQKKRTKGENYVDKFTVIGNRVTKEFIYCVKLVRGLYKYRRISFEAPTIRGINGVEWPQVWNDLKVKYGGTAYCLSTQVAVLVNGQLLGGQKELKELIEAKYTYHIWPDYYNEAIAEFSKYIDNSSRPCVYMHFSIDNEHSGTMIFMLYSDIVPRTCENFMRLCKEKKGGYAGTPVHRIVKDGWIQCGGFGLKDTQLGCENFIVPPDRRGVLCMANDGRHIDCSTQFFVLLQPAPWMEKKYVALGQLIDGKQTLKIIENVPTCYESPTCKIIIYQAGILNLDCQELVINKGTNEYIDGHIENLSALSSLLYKDLLEKTFSELEARLTARLEQKEQDLKSVDKDWKNLRATKRFIRRKEDIENQLKTSEKDNLSPSITISEEENVNEEFDVEAYDTESENEYEAEESLVAPESYHSVIKPEKPFYIPLTDVPYPGEIDSTHDLKKFLKGHYCLEEDLIKDLPKRSVKGKTPSYISEMIDLVENRDSSNISYCSLDSDDEKEIRRYIKLNADRVSFAGGIVKGIARGIGKYNIFEDARKSELITEELRRFRLASIDYRTKDDQDKKVSLSLPALEKTPVKIKRRQTGYALPEPGHVEYVSASKDSSSLVSEELAIYRKVRIAPHAISKKSVSSRPSRRPTGFVQSTTTTNSDTEVRRRSVLTRLYDDVTQVEDPGPTLKDYKPMSNIKQKNILLTFSTDFAHKSDESTRDRYPRHTVKVGTAAFDRVMNIQHNKKLVRKVSSDYVKTLDQIEQQFDNSIRSIEFAKKRPSMTVSQYKQKNQMLKESLKETTDPSITQIEK